MPIVRKVPDWMENAGNIGSRRREGKKYAVEDEALDRIAKEAEARLAQRRAARAEARELRLRELEKQQQDQENEEEKQFGTPAFAEPSPRAAAPTRTPLSRTGALSSAGQFSRRSSEDSTTDDSALPANVREMRAELKELDEKFRKAMITNAQLGNEKATLTFEVELMKDKYTELEETHTQLSKEHRKKCTEYEQLKKVATKLQEEVKALRALLQERDALIQEYGLVVVGEEENGEADIPVKDEDDEFADMDDLTPRKIAVKKALLSQEAADLLSKGAAQDSLDVRLKKFGEEKKELEDQVRRLKLELEEEKNKNRRRKENGLDYDRQKEQNKTVNEYKFRVQKAEAEVSTLQANVARLDALSARYRTQSEELEKSEEELKSEKRKLQRELRELQQKYDELDSAKNFLQRQYDKMRHDRIGRF
uniref:Leucine-rich repeat flightless-I-interacting protein 2A n=1 Tax=Penaeus vannamei TaxID=6689 RepID=L7UW52_PENVA|nr:leucine-rich repeat flightless-I-interacting protein 2A [Penaeus vannamei]